ncbi:MAG: hypothetical protein Q8910_00275 [Bacteroidota bacterium]|nr:hypothetical protein [Bacteroidota bacterium]
MKNERRIKMLGQKQGSVMYQGFVIDNLTGSIIFTSDYCPTYQNACVKALRIGKKLIKSCGNIDHYSIDVQ